MADFPKFMANGMAYSGEQMDGFVGLTFELVLAMVLRKSVKSLQNVANEAMSCGDRDGD